VVDKTGITGVFPVHLTFVPDESMLQLPGPPGDAGNPAAAADAGPSIFTALQEQLGLRLQSGKGPVGVLVIDHEELIVSDTRGPELQLWQVGAEATGWQEICCRPALLPKPSRYFS
jgi:hypothetical protein